MRGLLINAICVAISGLPLMAPFGSDAAAQNVKSGEGSAIVSLFIARRVSSLTEYDAQRKKQSATTKSASSEARTASKGSQTTKTRTNKTNLETETSGSTTLRTAKNVYQELSSTDLGAAMTSIFAPAGYETIEYDDVVSECGGVERSVISDIFKTADDMPRKIWKSARKAAQECDVHFFARGTMTAGVARTHQSGLKLVTVSVRGSVFDISKRLPRRIGAIGPVQFGGRGRSEEVAMRNALNLAAKKTASIITKQLENKNIQ